MKRIVCLANSFKTGGFCIAGKEVLPSGYGRWVRPVSARLSAEVRPEECRYGDGGLPKLLDVIDIPLLRPDPRMHQTENYLIDAGRRWVKTDELPIRALRQMEEHPQTLWINSDKTRAGAFNCLSQDEAASLHDSLTLIRPDNFTVKVGSQTREGKPERTYHGAFSYRTVLYVLKLTDPQAIAPFKNSQESDYPFNNVHICVSLTEPFKDNRCHKLVAAVFNAQLLG